MEIYSVTAWFSSFPGLVIPILFGKLLVTRKKLSNKIMNKVLEKQPKAWQTREVKEYNFMNFFYF